MIPDEMFYPTLEDDLQSTRFPMDRYDTWCCPFKRL